MNIRGIAVLSICILGVDATCAARPTAQTAAFTYQGQLKQSGAPFSGSVDMQFRLFDAASAGTQIGSTLALNAVVVADGVFTSSLDFGALAFNGNERWLEIAVDDTPGGGVGPFTTLAPRQKLASAPYAAYALNASLPASYANAVNFSNAANAFAGSGAGLTNLDASALAAGNMDAGRMPVGGAWNLGANALQIDTNTLVLNPNSNRVGIGTSNPAQALHVVGNLQVDGQIIGSLGGFAAMEFVTGGVRTLRLERAAAGGSPNVNVIGGHPDNTVIALVGGATVFGGSQSSGNSVFDNQSTISGGSFNVAGADDGNVALSAHATVAGGYFNTASGEKSMVAGGSGNEATGSHAFVAGGSNTASGSHSAAVGGNQNVAGAQDSFAAGYRAKVRTPAEAGNSSGDFGTFVWADNEAADFISSAPNQFLIRAKGNVGINTNAPAHDLHVFEDSGVGRIRVESADNQAGVSFMSDSTGENIVYSPDATDDLRFYVNGADRLAILNTGNVGIGTTAPAQKLHVSNGGSGGTPFAAAELIAEDNADCYINLMSPAASERGISFGSPTNAVHGGVYYTDAGGMNLRTGGNLTTVIITSAGLVGIDRVPTTNVLEVAGNASKTTSGSWLANSDRRIKTDIETVASALDTLDRVRLTSFRYTPEYLKAHPSIEDRRYLNVIAQEFAQVFPEHVKGSGEYLPSGEEILQVDIHPLTIYSAAAIQELRAQVRDKDAEIDSLQAEHAERIAGLENDLAALREVVQQLLRKER